MEVGRRGASMRGRAALYRVLLPPLGTGTLHWPVRQALVNWLYGAIIWYRSNSTVTARSVWPVLCVPGPGDQKVMGHYLSELSCQRLEVMRDRRLTIRVRYEGQGATNCTCVPMCCWAPFGRTAFSSLKFVRVRYRHGAGLKLRRSGTHSITMPILTSLGQYSLTVTSLRHMFPFESDGPLTTALSRRRFGSQPAWGTLGAPVR